MIRLVIIFGIIAAITAIGGFSYRAGYVACAEETQKTAIESLEKARKIEREKQRKADEITQQNLDNLAAINAALTDDIIRLQSRKDRGRLSRAAKTECPAATGRELSKPDAEFLVRLAARADQLRSALNACYQYADEIMAK